MNQKIQSIAELILEGFNRHFRIFSEHNQLAAQYFALFEFNEAANTAKKQVGLYDLRVDECLVQLKKEFQIDHLDESLWRQVKRTYMGLLYDHLQPELAESFYNSLFCRLFNRRYYNNQYIFVNSAINTSNIQTDCPEYRCYYPKQNSLETELNRLFTEIPIKLPYEDLPRDINYLIRAIHRYLDSSSLKVTHHFQIHIATPIFYRNKGAYIIGRIIEHSRTLPFVIPLLNRNGLLYVDAFLDDEDDLSNIFSFARAYFKVDFPVPSALVRFMKTIVPGKSLADLYTAIGFHKQGKNEFYRSFLYHLRHSTDRFVVAPGIEGMVMHVFTLPSYPYVFKIIKDRFHANKNISRTLVKERYQMVKQVDRVGRMADTWEFSHVAFPLARFSEESLLQLKQHCFSGIEIDGEHLILRHVYIERRMVPLNIYIEQADQAEKERVVIEYGHAIEEIASAGVFPGDLLMKNFGVTRHGRVVFYDYDEVVPIEECVFRDIPETQNLEQEMASEPWYHVGEHDVFPEEFEYYLVADAHLRRILKCTCPGLTDSRYWKQVQQRKLEGVLPDIFPYKSSKRFHYIMSE